MNLQSQEESKADLRSTKLIENDNNIQHTSLANMVVIITSN